MEFSRRRQVNRVYLTPLTGAYLFDCDSCGAPAGRPCRKTRKDSDGTTYVVGNVKKPHPGRGKT